MTISDFSIDDEFRQYRQPQTDPWTYFENRMLNNKQQPL